MSNDTLNLSARARNINVNTVSFRRNLYFTVVKRKRSCNIVFVLVKYCSETTQQNAVEERLIYEERTRDKMNEKRLKRLIAGIANGDKNSFATLYEETKRGVYAFVYPYCNDRYAAEDCVQDVYMKIFRYAGSYRPDGSPRAWILQIAKNTALDEARKKKRTVPLEKVPDSYAYRAEPTDSFVFDTLNRVLDEEERYIVVAHVLWDYKHKEIAAALGCPVGTATSKYKRSIEKLKKALKEESL